jgi:hypothetical protein
MFSSCTELLAAAWWGASSLSAVVTDTKVIDGCFNFSSFDDVEIQENKCFY